MAMDDIVKSKKWAQSIKLEPYHRQAIKQSQLMSEANDEKVSKTEHNYMLGRKPTPYEIFHVLPGEIQMPISLLSSDTIRKIEANFRVKIGKTVNPCVLRITSNAMLDLQNAARAINSVILESRLREESAHKLLFLQPDVKQLEGLQSRLHVVSDRLRYASIPGTQGVPATIFDCPEGVAFYNRFREEFLEKSHALLNLPGDLRMRVHIGRFHFHHHRGDSLSRVFGKVTEKFLYRGMKNYTYSLETLIDNRHLVTCLYSQISEVFTGLSQNATHTVHLVTRNSRVVVDVLDVDVEGGSRVQLANARVIGKNWTRMEMIVVCPGRECDWSLEIICADKSAEIPPWVEKLIHDIVPTKITEADDLQPVKLSLPGQFNEVEPISKILSTATITIPLWGTHYCAEIAMSYCWKGISALKSEKPDVYTTITILGSEWDEQLRASLDGSRSKKHKEILTCLFGGHEVSMGADFDMQFQKFMSTIFRLQEVFDTAINAMPN